MTKTGYQFAVVADDGIVAAQAFEVFAYPMGDITVRQTPGSDLGTGSIQLMHVSRTAVDWTLVRAWAGLAAELFPEQPRVLALPYLPSARGDKDTPSPATVNATLAAESGITDLITIDPHSPVWLSALRAAQPLIREHTLPLRNIVRCALEDDGVRGEHLGVISPDKGAVARAGDVAEYLDVPLHVADKHRDPSTGSLTHYSLNADLAPGAYLVVDDIFDGGGTFALLAGAVPDGVVLDLWVTHGGFTKPNFSDAARAPYRHIYTTDSLGSAIAAGRADCQIRVSALQPWIVAAISPVPVADRPDEAPAGPRR